jgi:hypothetical protein
MGGRPAGNILLASHTVIPHTRHRKLSARQPHVRYYREKRGGKLYRGVLPYPESASRIA